MLQKLDELSRYYPKAFDLRVLNGMVGLENHQIEHIFEIIRQNQINDAPTVLNLITNIKNGKILEVKKTTKQTVGVILPNPSEEVKGKTTKSLNQSSELEAKLAEVNTELTKKRKKLSETVTRLASINLELSRRVEGLSKAEEKLSVCEGKILEIGADLRQKQELLVLSRSELSATEERIYEKRAELDEIKSILYQTFLELSEKEKRLLQIRTEISDSEARLQQIEVEISEVQSHLAVEIGKNEGLVEENRGENIGIDQELVSILETILVSSEFKNNLALLGLYERRHRKSTDFSGISEGFSSILSQTVVKDGSNPLQEISKAKPVLETKVIREKPGVDYVTACSIKEVKSLNIGNGNTDKGLALAVDKTDPKITKPESLPGNGNIAGNEMILRVFDEDIVFNKKYERNVKHLKESQICNIQGNIFIIFGYWGYKDSDNFYMNFGNGYKRFSRSEKTSNQILEKLTENNSLRRIIIDPILAIRLCLEGKISKNDVRNARLIHGKIIFDQILFKAKTGKEVKLEIEVVPIMGLYEKDESDKLRGVLKTPSDQPEIASKPVMVPKQPVITSKLLVIKEQKPEKKEKTNSDVNSKSKISIFDFSCYSEGKKWYMDLGDGIKVVNVEPIYGAISDLINRNISMRRLANIDYITISPKDAMHLYLEGNLGDYYVNSLSEVNNGKILLKKMSFETLSEGIQRIDVIIDKTHTGEPVVSYKGKLTNLRQISKEPIETVSIKPGYKYVVDVEVPPFYHEIKTLRSYYPKCRKCGSKYLIPEVLKVIGGTYISMACNCGERSNIYIKHGKNLETGEVFSKLIDSDEVHREYYNPKENPKPIDLVEENEDDLLEREIDEKLKRKR